MPVSGLAGGWPWRHAETAGGSSARRARAATAASKSAGIAAARSRPEVSTDTSRQPLALHPGGRRMRRAAVAVDPLEKLAAAGFRVEPSGRLSLLRYVIAVRAHDHTTP